MAEGRSNQGICRTLWLSPKTVETHIRSAFAKLEIKEAPEDNRRVLAVLTYWTADGDGRARHSPAGGVDCRRRDLRGAGFPWDVIGRHRRTVLAEIAHPSCRSSMSSGTPERSTSSVSSTRRLPTSPSERQR